MTTNDQNGHLPATPIDVEPTDRQRAAHELAAAFGAAGEVDWTAVDANFRALVDAAGYESPVIEMGRTAAARINEALLTGQEPFCRRTSMPCATRWSTRRAPSRLSLWTESRLTTGRDG